MIGAQATPGSPKRGQEWAHTSYSTLRSGPALSPKAYGDRRTAVEARLPSAGGCFIVGAHHSKHDRIVGGAIIRALSKPVVVGRDPEHHRANCWVISFVGQRPLFLGSHVPVNCILEGIN
jgi:hypothetical protein